MADTDLRNMILNFRVSDLQVLLGFAGRNKTGKKQELQARAIDLLKIKSTAVVMKINELHNRRYNTTVRPSGYEMPERTLNETQVNPYNVHMNNNYGARCNPNVRPTPMHQAPSSSFPTTGKQYLPPLPTTNALPLYNIYADVKFKDLPFYDILYVLVPPTKLASDSPDRYNESTLYFNLTVQQAEDVSLSRNVNGHYDCQIMLRFCVSDSSSEQEDNFPPNVGVKVNAKVVTLPNLIPNSRPGVEARRPSKPVNLTPFSKISPTVTNAVAISWTSTYGRTYVAAIYIVRQLTSQALLIRLKNSGVRNPEYTTTMIKEKLQQGQDAEIATTSLRGSLICPLGKIRMELPCRAVTCTHLQCFDAYLYIQMNEKKPKWICPVCDKPAQYRMLAIDGLFVEIASKVPPDCTEVQFNEDGSWTPITPVKGPKETKKTVEKRSKKSSNPVEVVDICDSDSEEVWSHNLDHQAIKTTESPESLPLPLSPKLLFPTSQENSESYPLPLTQASNPFPNSLHMPSEIQNETSEPVSLLPDLLSTHTDTSMPSTSSSSPGLNSTSFLHMPFLNDGTYYSSASNPLPDQLGSVNGNQSIPSCNNFDFMSLFQVPDAEAQKQKDFEKKENTASPDVISLD
ncbi:hypothetical protein TNIN_348511 [Trichonephila inaurata madagascariensis]|uniref:E3 SUMO-protein ligase PIAS2 n=1 Tax=Trichonephila inaurata madagascariensis TaxID=2747483 RepID=A0A8X6WPB9_9ARAC|nr:hypothetical protein TNIN_348511 [Trichonephila inaurata madagascariensis]